MQSGVATFDVLGSVLLGFEVHHFLACIFLFFRRKSNRHWQYFARNAKYILTEVGRPWVQSQTNCGAAKIAVDSRCFILRYVRCVLGAEKYVERTYLAFDRACKNVMTVLRWRIELMCHSLRKKSTVVKIMIAQDLQIFQSMHSLNVWLKK